ncbi:MAG: hypothetical protein QOD94_2085 [Alphaproteobacteria bacterium]|nr:hypothetical protein [Alphaproteobacteria bacterium]
MRKLVLAVLAAWVVALPSVADAQGRGEGQGRPRPQIQQDRRGGGFSGMLNDIAGARLDRAHADRRSIRQPGNGSFRQPGNGRNQRQR